MSPSKAAAWEAGDILALAIRRPVAVLCGVILVIFFGFLAVFPLPIQLTSDISKPTVTVTTRWLGASPVEVESGILGEQEDVLKRVESLELRESEAQPSQGSVTLEFSAGTDIDQALVRISNQLAQVPDYPESADRPVVSTSRAAGPPLAVILVYDSDGESVGPDRTWVEEEIVPELERIKGVAIRSVASTRI
jgi:HAE1 family hydrophobic/amphiphilic exporter-1